MPVPWPVITTLLRISMLPTVIGSKSDATAGSTEAVVVMCGLLSGERAGLTQPQCQRGDGDRRIDRCRRGKGGTVGDPQVLQIMGAQVGTDHTGGGVVTHPRGSALVRCGLDSEAARQCDREPGGVKQFL